MQTPVGPSLHLVFLMAEVFADVSVVALSEVWNRWIGPRRLQRKLEQFSRRGWVAGDDGAPNLDRVIRLTDAGRIVALGGRDPERCWRRAWDGHWRLALFDVPENQRALRQKLQRNVRALGFGYLQHSVWVSPDSVDELKRIVQGAAIDPETLSLMQGRPCGGESDADLVRGAWDFERINRGYDVYLEVLDSMPRRRTGKAARSWFAVEWKAWCHAVRSDPLLPESLLPPSYRGRVAWQQRKEKLRELLKP